MRVLIFLSLILLSVGGFSQSWFDTIEVKTWPGPEDLVSISFNGQPQLLVSCSDRRNNADSLNGILSFNSCNGRCIPLERKNEPDSLELSPHGIAVYQNGDDQYLYVISHEKGDWHPIVRYKIGFGYLFYDTLFSNDLLTSPNAITAFADGSFFVCNDKHKAGNHLASMLGLKQGSILHFDGKGNWTIADTKLKLPSGITHSGDSLFVSENRANRILLYTIDETKLRDKKTFAQLKGPDNLKLDDDFIFASSHQNLYRFTRHAISAKKHSPSRLIRIDRKSGSIEVLFEDNGELISSASVIIPYDGRLYIGQVFGDKMISIPNRVSSLE